MSKSNSRKGDSKGDSLWSQKFGLQKTKRYANRSRYLQITQIAKSTDRLDRRIDFSSKRSDKVLLRGSNRRPSGREASDREFN